MTWRRRIGRIVQLVTGVHRIHHERWSYGWKLPFLPWAYFPAFKARDYRVEPPREVVVAYGWKRIERRNFHDCTRTGRY